MDENFVLEKTFYRLLNKTSGQMFNALAVEASFPVPLTNYW